MLDHVTLEDIPLPGSQTLTCCCCSSHFSGERVLQSCDPLPQPSPRAAGPAGGLQVYVSNEHWKPGPQPGSVEQVIDGGVPLSPWKVDMG